MRAAWQGASEEWRERTEAAKARRSDAPKRVREAYGRLGLRVDSRLEAADRARRELIKKYHPDRFPDPDQQRRAAQVTAEINAAHDTIRRYLMRKGEL
jgi:DnaJ-class molecular chaperone